MEVLRVLATDGLYVLIGHDQYGHEGRRWLGSLPRFARLAARSPFDPRLRRGGGSPPTKQEAMATLRSLLESGQLRPVIDRSYPLEQLADAFRREESGAHIGKICVEF